jgi:hypothetical protein
MKSVDQEKIVQLFESNVPAMRLPLAFPELSKRRQVKEALERKTSGVSNYQRTQVALFAFRPLCGCCQRGSRDAGSHLGARLTR